MQTRNSAEAELFPPSMLVVNAVITWWSNEKRKLEEWLKEMFNHMYVCFYSLIRQADYVDYLYIYLQCSCELEILLNYFRDCFLWFEFLQHSQMSHFKNMKTKSHLIKSFLVQCTLFATPIL